MIPPPTAHTFPLYKAKAQSSSKSRSLQLIGEAGGPYIIFIPFNILPNIDRVLFNINFARLGLLKQAIYSYSLAYLHITVGTPLCIGMLVIKYCCSIILHCLLKYSYVTIFIVYVTTISAVIYQLKEVNCVV